MTLVERAWTHAGLDCIVVLQSLGHRCGYVRVPNGHPWHGKAYNDLVPGPIDLDAERSMDDVDILALFAAGISDNLDAFAATVSGRVAVHGGVTFGDDWRPKGGPRGWWFGFDCAHAGDTPDVWTEDAVAAETERMADQIAAAREAVPS